MRRGKEAGQKTWLKPSAWIVQPRNKAGPAAKKPANAVRYLLERGVAPAPVDRWGGTPLDDAIREHHHEVAEVLRAAGKGA